MKIEIRDITPEEAAEYGEQSDILLADRKAVVFTDDDGNTGVLFMEQKDIDTLGKRYIEENSRIGYSTVMGEWIPNVSWNAYMNNPERNPPKTIEVEFVELIAGEDTEIWHRLDTGGYLMRKLCNEPFARWMTCYKHKFWYGEGNRIRPNITFRNGKQTETVRYDDWNETAAYSDTFNPNFREG